MGLLNTLLSHELSASDQEAEEQRRQKQKLLEDQQAQNEKLLEGMSDRLTVGEMQQAQDHLAKTGQLPAMLDTGQNETAKFSSPLSPGGVIPPMKTAPTNTPGTINLSAMPATAPSYIQDAYGNLTPAPAGISSKSQIIPAGNKMGRFLTFNPMTGELIDKATKQAVDGILPNDKVERLEKPERTPEQEAEREMDKNEIKDNEAAVKNAWSMFDKSNKYEKGEDGKVAHTPASWARVPIEDRLAANKAAISLGYGTKMVPNGSGKLIEIPNRTKQGKKADQNAAIQYLRKNHPEYPETPRNIQWAMEKLNSGQ